MNNMLFKRAIPHISAVVIFLVVSVAYFFPQLEGKEILQHDITSFKAVSQELVEFEEETGKSSMWTNSIFCGMPAYQIRAASSNVLQILERTSQLFIERPIGYFISAMIGFYILLVLFGVNPWLAIGGAIGFAFCTNTMVLYDAGHMSKLRALFTAAPAVAGLLLTYRKRYLLGGVIFAAAMGMQIYSNHYQITYLFLLTFGIYAIFELVRCIREQEIAHFAKASGILAAGLLVAFVASADRLLPTMEYARDTMRGKPILENNTSNTRSSSTEEGLAWDYAMNWSNGGIDLLGTIIPRAAGGSGAEAVGEDSNLYQDFRARGVRLGGDFRVPLYHGELPGTSGPVYLGAVLLFLALLGALLVPGRVKWWLVTVIALTLLMSMGKYFESFNRLLFDYLPYYNKFRAPSSIVTITSVFVPLLGFLGVKYFMDDSIDAKARRRGLFIATGVTAGVCALVAALGGSLTAFDGANDQAYANMGYSVDALKADRLKYMRADALRSFFFILLAGGALLLHLRGTLRTAILAGALGVLILADLWGIDRRYIATEDFISESQGDRVFAMRAVDREIKKDNDPHYRVHDVTVDAWNSAEAAYHHKMIGGYHPAKLQRFQDMMDYYLYEGNQDILNMLNAKYYILPDQQNKGPRVQTNGQAYGNAWFVENIQLVGSADEEIGSLRTADLRSTAIVHSDFEDKVRGFDPQRNGNIRLTSYAPNKLTYEYNASSDQLAVFSEVWYGPDKGWKAYLDGEPVDIIRANYILRAIRVPQGQHSLEMVFKPSSRATGKILTIVFSALILITLLYALYLEYRRAQESQLRAEASKQGKKKPSSTKSRRKKS